MKLLYCPECALGLVKINDVLYVCSQQHEYYNNPRSGVAIVMVKDGKILFSKRAKEPAKGKYDLVGGFVDPHETLEQAAIREIKEELDVTLTEFRYLASINNTYANDTYACDTFFLATAWEGIPSAHDDVSDIEWREPSLMASDDFAWPAWRPLVEPITKAVNQLKV
jgi:NAD+ diphosphatase